MQSHLKCKNCAYWGMRVGTSCMAQKFSLIFSLTGLTLDGISWYKLNNRKTMNPLRRNTFQHLPNLDDTRLDRFKSGCHLQKRRHAAQRVFFIFCRFPICRCHVPLRCRCSCCPYPALCSLDCLHTGCIRALAGSGIRKRIGTCRLEAATSGGEGIRAATDPPENRRKRGEVSKKTLSF